MNEQSHYLSATKAAKYFGVHKDTLTNWEREGLIKLYRTKPGITGHKRYDVSSFKGLVPSSTESIEPDPLKGVCYCRVSTRTQKDDLERQVQAMQAQYPAFRIIKDFGSGINFKRKGLLSLLKDAIEGNISTVVVSHRDRLTRFGFELFQWLFEQYRVKLVVLEESVGSKQDELCKDLLSIIHVFSSRANGGRRKREPAEGETIEEKGSPE